MSVIQFPSSPALNQTFTVGYKTWIWNGYAWDLQVANTSSVTTLAQSAFDKANSVVQTGFTTITANGVNISPSSNADTLVITSSSANGINVLNPSSKTIDLGLRNSGVTSGTYGNSTIIPVITVDNFGRVTSVSNTNISNVITSLSGTTDRIVVTSPTGASTIDLAPITGLTAGTYSYPLLQVDSYGRVISIANQSAVTSVAGVSGSVSNNSILAGLLTVDGSGSGLDADLLDGLTGSSYANTVYIQGVTDSQNTNITNLQTWLSSNNTLQVNINATQNTRITNLESGLGANVAYIAGIDATQNTNITNLQTWLASNNTLQVNINATQNTNISSANTLAQAAFDKANTGGGSSSGYLANSIIFANTTGYLSNTSGFSYFTSNNTLTTPNIVIASNTTLTSYTETSSSPTISAGALTLNLLNSSVFNVTVNGAITSLTISNIAATGKVSSFILMFDYTGTAYSVTWPASFRWPGGTAPILTNTNGKRDIFTIFTNDGGTNWNAFISGQNL